MNRVERRHADRADTKRLLGYRPTLAQTARHEAGHAVACSVLGAPFDFAEVGSHAVAVGASGLHRVRGSIGQFTADPFTTAVILFCGPLAEGSWLGGLEDAAKIKALDPTWPSSTFPGSPKATAARLVAEHADAINRVAAALLDRGRLTAAEVADLVAVGVVS